MNIGKAFDKFLKQGRLINEVIIHPDDQDNYNLDISWDGKFYKWTAKVKTSKDIHKGCFELISFKVFDYQKELREIFS